MGNISLKSVWISFISENTNTISKSGSVAIKPNTQGLEVDFLIGTIIYCLKTC